MTENRKIYLYEILGLVFISFALYFQTLKFDFVWDDGLLIVANPYFHQKFDWVSVFTKGLWTFSSIQEALPYYRPIVTLVYWIETKLWGFNATYFHAANLFMHTASVLLVWVIAIQFKLSSMGRRIACLFFSLHPAQVGCVSFISCHGDLLVQMLGLLSILIWMRNDRCRWWALITVFLAMLCKEAGVVLPLILISYDIIFRRRSLHRLVTWIPGLLFAPYFLLRHWAMASSEPVSITWDFLWKNDGAFRTFAYISRVFFPIPTSQNPILPNVSMIGSLLLVIMLVSVVILIFRNTRINSLQRFFWTWLFFTIFIIANWVGQQVRFSDQLLYIPLVPISLLIGTIRFQSKRTLYYWISLFLVFGGVSLSQIPIWANDYDLWKNEVQYRKDSPAIVLNYVSAYNDKYFGGKQCDLYLHVLDLLQAEYDSKIHFLTLYDLGNCYENQQNLELAEKYLREAIEISDQYWMAQNSLIYVLTMQGKLDESLNLAKELVKNHPELFTPWRTLGVVHAKRHEFLQAVEAFQHAQVLSPNDTEIPKMIAEAKALQVKLDALSHGRKLSH